MPEKPINIAIMETQTAIGTPKTFKTLSILTLSTKILAAEYRTK